MSHLNNIDALMLQRKEETPDAKKEADEDAKEADEKVEKDKDEIKQ